MRARYQSAPYAGTGRVDRKINVSGTTESFSASYPNWDMGLFFVPTTVKNSFQEVNTMKKIICTIVALALLLGMAAIAEGTTYKVGICKYVDHASLDQIVENIENRLDEIGQEQGVTFVIDYQSDTEFGRLVYGKKVQDILPVIDELVSEAVRATNPRLYYAFIRRLK